MQYDDIYYVSFFYTGTGQMYTRYDYNMSTTHFNYLEKLH